MFVLIKHHANMYKIPSLHNLLAYIINVLVMCVIY